MSRSLSVVVPVHNVEKTLAENLQQLFEVLTDLTERFEVVLVDEGSTDQTIEVAQELAVRFPQVRVSRRSALDPDATSIEGTLAETSGDVIFIQTGHSAFRPSILRQLWAMDEHEASSGAPPPRVRSRLPGLPPRRLRSLSAPSSTEIDGLRVIHRR